jgi:uncharacterized membrane protein
MVVVDFKEASFIEGRLIRVAKKKLEIQLDDEESGEPAIATVKLADGVSIDLSAVGERVRAVIVDGKVARVVPIASSAIGQGPPPVSKVGS